MTELEKKAREYSEGMAMYYESTHDGSVPSQFEKYLRNAYLAGAEKNGVVWHDLRKTPEDLPETLHPVYAKLDSEIYVSAYCVNKIWHENDDGRILYHGNGKSKVIAWCEIPKFEEEV